MHHWKRYFVLIALLAGTLLADGTQPTGSGTSGDPYQVSTLDHLLWISTNSSSWGSVFVQTASINASATSGWNGGDGWSPIGNSTTKFTGSYNGQGYAITGLTVDRSATDYQGLFGYTDGATIQSLSVTGASITGDNCTGALAGYKNGGSFNGCQADGAITGSNYTGGLVGYNYGGTVTACSSSGSVNAGGTSSGVGGLAGYCYGTMSYCYSSASAGGHTEVGGLVGNNYYGAISNCYSTGSVTGYGTTGAMVGYNYGTASISNCYSRGSVTWTGGYLDLGGFAGNNDTNASIEYCYSTGSVDCGGYTNKGFVGSNSGTCTANFFDSEASGQSTGFGATAENTAAMKTHTTFTAAGWDFEAETANGTNNYWDMDYSGTLNGGYPYLSWQDGGDVSLSVALSLFSARFDGECVVLSWTTESEVENLGFILERADGNANAWRVIASYKTHDALKGRGNTSNRTEYGFTDANVERGKGYSYRLTDVNFNGKATVHSPIFIQLEGPPEAAILEAPYPNPFNPQTYIGYDLPKKMRVQIAVCDLLGRSVKSLYDGVQPAGTYHVYWNGTDAKGIRAPSGVYLIRMRMENATEIRKVMLMR